MTSSETPIRSVIVGTAGHIEHGKSAIVKALTGTDPDRLVEERERGMTIDLGFARYQHDSGALVGIIDVPGHERFIKNMVAGATSIDVVMLVVAADDGVMPQTREHLEILELLGVERGLIVVNKIDLVDQDLLDLAVEDIRDFVAGTFLDGAPLVRVSATGGVGIDDLRGTLDTLVAEVPMRSDAGPFRLPVQRVFSAKGHGTVVTGVPVSGAVAAGDVLDVVGTGHEVRVRGIQAYGDARDSGRAGHSTALNVTGVSKDEIRRGDVVATRGLYRRRRRVLASYTHTDASAVLRNNHPVRLHVGTAEVLGRAVVLDGDGVEPGGRAYIQLRLDEPVVSAAGDRYILRHAASLRVLGGGRVLAAGDGRLKRFKQRVLGEAQRREGAQGDPLAQARVVLELTGRRGVDTASLAQETATPEAELERALASLVESGAVVRPTPHQWLDVGALEEVADEIDEVLADEHARNPLLEWLDIKDLRSRVDAVESVLRVALEQDRRFELSSGGRVRRAGYEATLNSDQAAGRERILSALRAGGTNPPEVDGALTGLSAADTAALVATMSQAGDIVRVGTQVYHGEVMQELRATVLEHGRERGGEIHIPTLRDALGTTRKYLIPLLEWCDAQGITVRRGDKRVLRGVS